MKALGTVWAHYSAYSKEYCYQINAAPTDMSVVGWVRVKDFELDFDPPSRDTLLQETVRGLRRKLDAMRVKHFEEQQACEAEINDLLCLEAPAQEDDHDL